MLTMIRERKCILCHTVYSSKKEMDEHMRSMLHHRELENLKGRDSNHECRVCKVMVVGLSAYAKHISSQLHKDNIEAHDAEEGEEEKEEEYFDKELIQLIKQRNEQSRAGVNRETEGDDRKLQRPQDDEASYQDRDMSGSVSLYHHGGPLQRDWKWGDEGFVNPRQGQFTHPTRKPNNTNRHLVSQRGQPGWHPNNAGVPPNWYPNYGNAGPAWHQNSGRGTSGRHRGGRGRNPNWSSGGMNIFSNWQSKNSGANWKPGPQNMNDWNLGRNRGENFMDASWFKNCSMHEKYTMERYSWQWQESGPVPFYPGLAKENGNFDCLLDFTSDQLPSDQLLNFVVCEQPESKTSKVNGKCTNPSREKMNRWTPYPSLKIVEQQPACVENVAKSSEKPDLAYLSLSHLSPKRTDSETGKPKMKKSEENYPVPTNSKMAPNKSAPCKGPRENNSVTKPGHAEGKGSKMPSLKSPLLAVPDIKPSSQKRSPKNLLKQVQMLLSSSSGERQNQLGTLSLESKNSPSSNGSKTSNEYNKPNNSKGMKQMLCNKEDQNEVLEKTKEEIQYNSYLQNSYSSPCRGTETDGNKGLSADSPPLKMHETQIAKLENETHKDITGNKSTQSKVCSPCDLTEPKCTAAKKGNHVGELGDTERNYADFQMDSLESQSSNQHNGGIDSKASLEEGGDKDNTKSNYVPEEESYGDLSNQELQKDLAGQSSGPLLPELSKLGFPASLQRDLTWRTNLKNKTGSHLPEPNLNSARRIRNVSGHRKNETEKESGLKPTLRQIISVSRRNVNWEQVIQQVTKKKQELGKGLPRFGIEMVPLIQSEQEGLELDEEADLSNLEGFHWEGISASSPGTVRKRSLSESSVVVDKMASAYSFFSNQSTSKENEQKLLRPAAHTEDTTSGSPVPVEAVAHVKQESASLPSSPFMADKLDPERRLSLQTPPDVNTIAAFETEEAQGSPQLLESHDMLEGPGERYSVASALTAFNTLDAATDSSYTSGNEQNDSQGTGKKRRATGEGSSPEIPCLERKNKRRKIKGKKERSQVDQLLSISLKEEELSKSLQCVDGSLLQARAALQAAYLEVQQLLVLKQQISVEMGTLRSQRIQILQGLQESYDPSEGPHQLHASSEKRPSKPQPAHDLIANPGLLVPLLETAQPLPAQRPPVPLAAGLQVSSPPTFQTPGSLGATSVPHSSLQVKEEPASPKHGEESMNIPEENTPRAEVQFQGGNTNQQSSLYPIISTAMSLSELIDFQKTDQDMEKALLEKGKSRLSGQSSVHGALLLLSAKAEENKTPADNTISEQCSSSIQNHPSPPQLCVNKAPKQTAKEPVQMVVSSVVSTDNKRKKKKKKLKKKKALRAAAQVPENSDTEQDVGDAKPFRKVKTIKLPKAGKVTTSTPLKQEDAAQEGKQKKEENESDTSLEFVEVPRSPLEVVAIVTSSESGDEKPDSPSKREAFGTSEQLLKEASWSGYDEVSSTSEMGTNYRDGTARNVAETQTSISSIRGSKNSSEASSEPGEDEEPTEGVFESHSGSVNGIQIFGNLLYTCSGDKTIRAYNLVNRKCVGVFEGHTSKVNCLLVIQTTGKNAALYSGSSDHTIHCYNIKTRELVDQFKLDDRVLCLHSRWKILYAGLANGTVVTFNIKNNRQLDTFECHAPRAISCLATSQEGARGLLIVGSYDCTISVRDARNGLLLRTLEGHSKTVLCMKVVNDLVFSGSSDQSVHAHNIHTGELVRIYKGHNHAVTVVNILGKVMVTACLDKCVRVYELQSHDRLQVYGGHSDMIMCMAIHKSMIYTGCYDGSIQCVRLNLMQNYRCWWHGCSLIFGVMDHMKQHLLNDHTNPTFLTLKCRWKNCDAFFTSRKSSKQDAVEHIEKHAEADSKIDS